jgi:hypothetical protein
VCGGCREWVNALDSAPKCPLTLRQAQDERGGDGDFQLQRRQFPHPFVLSLSKDDLPTLESRAFGPKADTMLRMQAAYDLAQARARKEEIMVDGVTSVT